MNCNRWDVALVKYPFTDPHTIKKRPALVLSTHSIGNNGYAIIMMITTSKATGRNYGDYQLKDWKEAGLLKPSTVKMRFATVNTDIIIKKIGQLQRKDISFLKDIITSFIAH